MKKETQVRFEKLRCSTKGTSHDIKFMADGRWRFRFTNMFDPPVFTGTLEGVISKACDWIDGHSVATPCTRMLRTKGESWE